MRTVGVFTLVVDSEELTILDPPSGDPGFKGTFTVCRDQIEATDDRDTITARWSFDGEALTITDVAPERSPFDVVWTSHPWLKGVIARNPQEQSVDPSRVAAGERGPGALGAHAPPRTATRWQRERPPARPWADAPTCPS